MESVYKFFENNSLYIVLVINLLIWLGIFIFMQRIEKRLEKLERDYKNE